MRKAVFCKAVGRQTSAFSRRKAHVLAAFHAFSRRLLLHTFSAFGVTCWAVGICVCTRKTAVFPSSARLFQNNALVERQRKSKCKQKSVSRGITVFNAENVKPWICWHNNMIDETVSKTMCTR